MSYNRNIKILYDTPEAKALIEENVIKPKHLENFCWSSVHFINLAKIFASANTKKLIEENVIKPESLSDKFVWHSASCFKTNSYLIRLTKLVASSEAKELIKAKIIKPKYLAEKLTDLLENFDETYKYIVDLVKISDSAKTKELIEAKIITRESIAEKFDWYSGDFDEHYKLIVELAALYTTPAAKELIEAKIIKPEYLAKRYHNNRWGKPYDNTYNEIMKLRNLPINAEKIAEIKAFKKATATGAFSSKVPSGPGGQIGLFINVATAGALASVSRQYHDSAKTSSVGIRKNSISD